MATTLKDALIEDMERMEQAAIDLTIDHKVSLAKIVYWVCVANLHIITWLLRDKK